MYRVLFWSWLLLAKLGTLVLLMLLGCGLLLELLGIWVLDATNAAEVRYYMPRRVAMLEYCVRLLGNWVLGAAIAAGLWDAAKAARLLCIGCR